MKSQSHLVEEGYSMNYLVHGTFLILFSVCALAVSSFWSIPLLLAGLAALLVRTGVEITNSHQIRSYKSLFGKRIGHFHFFTQESKPILVHSKSAAYLHSRGSSTRVRQESFNLCLLHENVQVSIHEFTDRRAAYDFKVKSKNILGIDVLDDYGKKLSRAQKKQPRKRRNASNNI